MKKDLAYFNTKWWYRLIKVIFIFFFIVSILSIGLITYAQNRPYVQDDYIVQCNYGTKAQFTALKDKDIYLPVAIVGDGSDLGRIPEGSRKQLQTACGISDDDINKMLNSLWDELSTGKPLNTTPLWTLTPVQYRIGTESKAILFSLIAIVPVVLSFEIVRIAFYYVLTGSFFPDQRKKYSLSSSVTKLKSRKNKK